MIEQLVLKLSTLIVMNSSWKLNLGINALKSFSAAVQAVYVCIRLCVTCELVNYKQYVLISTLALV